MANVLEDGADWLASQLEDFASRSFVYRRQVLESDPLSATCSLQKYEVFEENDGLPVQVQMYDVLLRRSLLVVGGELIEPRPGDRLRDAVNGQEYEVAPVGKQPCFELADTSGIQLLIHTNRVL